MLKKIMHLVVHYRIMVHMESLEGTQEAKLHSLSPGAALMLFSCSSSILAMHAQVTMGKSESENVVEYNF